MAKQKVSVTVVNPNPAADFEKAFRKILIEKLAARVRQCSVQ